MNALSTKLGLTAAMAILAFPSAATAQRVVPPGNSAATQYTETFPTAKGNAKTRHHVKRSPAKVLGARNVRRLEAAAPQGRAVAEVAAATGPAPAHIAPKADRHPATHAESPGGSSGMGQVIAAATGSSDSGELGLLLPLLIVCALVGSTAYFWRQKRRTA